MKNFFLLLATSSIALGASAQSKSIVFKDALQTSPYNLIQADAPAVKLARSNNSTPTGRTTATYTAWFDFYGQNEGTSSVNYIWPTAPDSNIVYTGTTTTFNIFTHGMGVSFDPTDDYYYSLAALPITDPQITNSTAYTVDSFGFAARYTWNNTSIPSATQSDSIIVILASTTAGGSTAADSGIYALQYTVPNAAFALVTDDSTPRFATGIYTRAKNEMYDSIIAPKQRFAFPLTIADTAFRVWTFPLTMNVKPGRKVVSYIHFKSAVNYSLGTAASAANFMVLYGGEPAGATSWQQQPARNVGTGYPGSYQAGLTARGQIRNSDTGFVYDGHNILLPSVAYNNPPGFTAQGQYFHIVWAGTSDVNNVASTITRTAAVPNPANGELNILFNLQNAGNSTVTLSNAVGQIVASQNFNNAVNGKVTFNTTNLAEGMYIYTVNTNGGRTTGRVVVAH